MYDTDEVLFVESYSTESDDGKRSIGRKKLANLFNEWKKRSLRKVLIIIGNLICVHCATSHSVGLH